MLVTHNIPQIRNGTFQHLTNAFRRQRAKIIFAVIERPLAAYIPAIIPLGMEVEGNFMSLLVQLLNLPFYFSYGGVGLHSSIFSSSAASTNTTIFAPARSKMALSFCVGS